MRVSIKLVIPTLAASLLLAACGSSATTSTTQPAKSASAGAGSGAGSAALVKTASNSKLGTTVLVDAHGMTLYHLSGEQNGKFICTGACVHVWPPLIAHGSVPKGAVGSLGTVKRPGGGMQVTYKGAPLYTFAHDRAPGQANGQGLKDVGTWTAATSSRQASAAPAAPTTSTSTSSKAGGGYAY